MGLFHKISDNFRLSTGVPWPSWIDPASSKESCKSLKNTCGLEGGSVEHKRYKTYKEAAKKAQKK